MLSYRKAISDDSEFIYECMAQLVDQKFFSLKQFYVFFEAVLAGELGKTEVWICSNETQKIGCISVNQFTINRYLGYGVEFEEVVILPEFRNQGFGKLFLEFLMGHYENDIRCRKIIVKTNDIQGSGKLYNKVVGITDMQVYQKFLNKL